MDPAYEARQSLKAPFEFPSHDRLVELEQRARLGRSGANPRRVWKRRLEEWRDASDATVSRTTDVDERTVVKRLAAMAGEELSALFLDPQEDDDAAQSGEARWDERHATLLSELRSKKEAALLEGKKQHAAAVSENEDEGEAMELSTDAEKLQVERKNFDDHQVRAKQEQLILEQSVQQGFAHLHETQVQVQQSADELRQQRQSQLLQHQQQNPPDPVDYAMEWQSDHDDAAKLQSLQDALHGLQKSAMVSMMEDYDNATNGCVNVYAEVSKAYNMPVSLSRHDNERTSAWFRRVNRIMCWAGLKSRDARVTFMSEFWTRQGVRVYDALRGMKYTVVKDELEQIVIKTRAASSDDWNQTIANNEKYLCGELATSPMAITDGSESASGNNMVPTGPTNTMAVVPTGTILEM